MEKAHGQGVVDFAHWLVGTHRKPYSNEQRWCARTCGSGGPEDKRTNGFKYDSQYHKLSQVTNEQLCVVPTLLTKTI